MTTLNQSLALDDYRPQVVQGPKACDEPARVVKLLSDVETNLAATQTSVALQKGFWRGLSQDLDLLAQLATLIDLDAAAKLRVVITIARATATRGLGNVGR